MSTSGVLDDSDDDFIPDDSIRGTVRPQQRPVKRRKPTTGKENVIRGSNGRSKCASVKAIASPAVPTQRNTKSKPLVHPRTSYLRRPASTPSAEPNPSLPNPSQLPANPAQLVHLQSSRNLRPLPHLSPKVSILAPDSTITTPTATLQASAAAEERCPVCGCNL